MGLNLGLTIMSIPPALVDLMALYGVSYTRISVLMSALFWTHALLQVPAGMIGDRFGVARTLIMSLTFMAVGNLVPAAVPSLNLAILGRVLTGIGTGLSFVIVMKFVALYAPQGRIGTYQSFYGGFFSLGSMLAYLVIPRVVAVGWQWAYLMPGLSSLPLVAMLFGLRLPLKSSAVSFPLPLGKILCIREGWVLGFYQALSWGAMITLGNWIPSLLADVWTGFNATQLAWGGALAMLVSGLGRLLGGVMLLRVTPLHIAHGSIVLLCGVFLALFFVSTPALVLILVLLAAWFASVNFGAIFHLVSRATSTDSLATLLGFVVLLANLGAILYTLMFGWFKDVTGSFSGGFAVLFVLSLTAFMLGRVTLKKE